MGVLIPFPDSRFKANDIPTSVSYGLVVMKESLRNLVQVVGNIECIAASIMAKIAVLPASQERAALVKQHEHIVITLHAIKKEIASTSLYLQEIQVCNWDLS